MMMDSHIRQLLADAALLTSIARQAMADRARIAREKALLEDELKRLKAKTPTQEEPVADLRRLHSVSGPWHY